MLAKDVFDLLSASYGDAVFGFSSEGGVKDPFARVAPDRLVEIARTLRDHPALKFEFLENVTAIDLPGTAPVAPPAGGAGSASASPGSAATPAESATGAATPAGSAPAAAAPAATAPGAIEVVYHFFSYTHRHDFVLKVSLPRETPRVPSLTPVWNSANWLEREQYDLMGVVFEGHPDLRRLLLPDDWVGHPLRKDYSQPPTYRGMSTTRPSPLDRLAAAAPEGRSGEGGAP